MAAYAASAAIELWVRSTDVIIGRDRELAEVVERVNTGRRLVTVIGPGGIGKSCLALAASQRLASAFPLGAHFVDLSRIDRPDVVAGTMAAQLGFPSVEALIESPTEQPALVVVDNCEHVTDAAAEAIDALLTNCRSPTVLATSRSPLDLPDESILALGPLAVPDGSGTDVAAGTTADGAGTTSAVQLFLDRARHAGGDATDLDLALVGELCRRLDGLPLAIEIAAARTRSLSLTEIVRRLDEGIDVLSRPRYRGSPRHRSLRDTISWSYRLLDGEAQATFDRLGVCVGPFTASMAAAVALDPPAATESAAQDVLERLVDASLLVADTTQSPTRYRMLAGVRAAALAQLEARGEVQQIRDRFADHVLQQATDVIAATRTTWGADVIGTLLAQFDNISAALRHCVAVDDTPDRAFVLYAVLWGVVHQAHLDEVQELGSLVFDRWPDRLPPATPDGSSASSLAADAAATLATAQLRLGRIRDAVALAERALPAADAGLLAPATLRRTLGLAARSTGDHDRALAWFTEAGAQARARDVQTLALECDVFRAQVLADVGRTTESLEIVREAAEAAREIGSVINELWARTIEGAVLAGTDPAAAVAVVEDTLARSRAIGYPFGVTTNLLTLVTCRVRSGELAGAADAALEMLSVIGRSGSGDLRLALEASVGVLRAADRPGWADLAATARALPRPIATANPIAQLDLPDAQGGRVLRRGDAAQLARSLLAELAAGGTSSVVDAARSAADVEEAVFELSGHLWDVRFAGINVHLKPSKGMSDLAVLLAQPHREVHCLDLTGAAVDEHSTGAAIDDTARRTYEERVRELQAEIDEAEDHHDVARAERAREELDAIVDQLTSALGLRGAARPQSATAERARSAVAHRLRSTIRRIAAVHPQLGRHLEVSVTSGTYCCYRPEREVVWRTGAAGRRPQPASRTSA